MRVVFGRVMKIQDYQAMLRAIDEALEVCDQSSGFMEQIHREICSELRTARDRLLGLIRAAELKAT